MIFNVERGIFYPPSILLFYQTQIVSFISLFPSAFPLFSFSTFSPPTCPIPLYLLEIPSIFSLFLVLLFSPSAFPLFSFYFFSPLTCPVPLYLLEIQSCFLRLATRYLHGRRSNLQWRIDLPIFRAKSIAKD